MKSKCVVTLACMLMVCLFLTTSYAGHDYGKEGYSMSDKVSKRAMRYLKNKSGLGLTDAQIKEIKDLKTNTKKQTIKDQAEIDLVATDIKAAMCEDPMDVTAVDALINKKYDLKKAKVKAQVKAYATLQNILTEEQKTKLKALCEKYKKDE